MVIATFLVRLDAGLTLRVLLRDHANQPEAPMRLSEATLAGL